MNRYNRLQLFYVLFFSCLFQIGNAQVTVQPVYHTPELQSSFKTTSVALDSLTLPFAEDFSGAFSMLDTIKKVPFTSGSVYEVVYNRPHGYIDGDSVRVFNSKEVIAGSGFDRTLFEGIRYIKKIDGFTFQLFTDLALTNPVTVQTQDVLAASFYKFPYMGYSTIPNSLYFLNNNGGCYINNFMGLHMPSTNVATFDGVNHLGVPYNTVNQFANGYNDNLTSLPFKLNKYKRKDSIYISFYWQDKTLGEAPEDNDYLVLELKDSNNVWKEVWRQYGTNLTVDTFYYQTVAIKDTIYFHKGFQFRFRNYGNQSGPFDIFNIDAIYIDKNRSFNEPTYGRDIRISSIPNSYFNTFTRIPYKHFYSLSSASQTALVNTSKNIFLTQTVLDLPSAKTQCIIYDNFGVNIDTVKLDVTNSSDYRFEVPYSSNKLPTNPNKPQVIKQFYSIGNTDATTFRDFSFNNFSMVESYLYEDYGYDDGTAEYSLSNNLSGTKIANQYECLSIDTLTHIDICFLKSNGADLTGLKAYLKVWDNSFNEIYSELISIKYGVGVNGFARYPLNSIVKLSSNQIYYVGIQQNFNENLFLGYDRNNDQTNKIYINNSGTFYPFTPIGNLTGSLMIRPVFSKNEVITSIDNAQETVDYKLFPNPIVNKTDLNIEGPFENYILYNNLGNVVAEGKITNNRVTIDCPSGIYSIHFSNNKLNKTYKLIVVE